MFALIEGVDAGWTSPSVLGAAAVGIAAGVAFFAVELRRARPLFDMRVLTACAWRRARWRSSTPIARRSGCCSCFPSTCSTSALASGFELAPFGLGLGTLAAVSGRLVPRYGPRVVLVAGLPVAAAGYVPLLLLSDDSSAVPVVLGTGIVGCGMGLTFPPATAVITNDLGLEKAGDGTAVNQLAGEVGGALGVAIVGSVFAAICAAKITDDTPAAAKESIEGRDRRREPPPWRGRCRLLHDAVSSFDVAAPGASPCAWRSSSSRRPAPPSGCHA